MKRWITVQILAVLVVLIFGLVCKANFRSCGIAEMKTYDDAYSLDCGVQYFYGIDKEDENKTYKSFSENEDDLISTFERSPIIIIGKSTGKLSQCKMSFAQEITVEKIIKGNGIEEGKSYNIYGPWGFNVDKNNKPIYTKVNNIMNPDSRYLMFITPSELNGRTSENTYYFSDCFMGYLNLSSDSSNVITKNAEDLRFSELKDTEFFASSQRILDQMYVIKKKVIEKYIENN